MILRTLKHPPLALGEVDPTFFCAYDESKHGEQLMKDLNLLHLEPNVREQVYAPVKRYWSVFHKKGVFVSVKSYECIINTGDAQSIAVKKIPYGPKELPIMRNAIAALEKLGHIRQIHDGL
jgi:hypothetical protein